MPNTKQMERGFYFIMDARRVQCLAERVLELGLEALRPLTPNRISSMLLSEKGNLLSPHFEI